MTPPPLLGDGRGHYRVHVVGNSGVGKGGLISEGPLSTTGKALAELLGVPFIALDTFFWNPGWKMSTNEEMRSKVEAALADAPNGWVVDGNYTRKIGTIVEESSTDVVWLDPPLALYLPRLIWRTFLGLLSLREPCSPGCRERVSDVFFSKESIIWWCITNHRPSRARQRARMAQIGLGVGNNIQGQKMRRIGGWGGELRGWFSDVKHMLRSE